MRRVYTGVPREAPPDGPALERWPLAAIGPLSPGNPGSGGWMPRWQRRWRSHGFVVGTDAGAWVFDGPAGPKRADALSRRFGLAQ